MCYCPSSMLLMVTSIHSADFYDPAPRSVPTDKKIAKAGLRFRLRRTQCNSSHRRFNFSKLREGHDCHNEDNSWHCYINNPQVFQPIRLPQDCYEDHHY